MQKEDFDHLVKLYLRRINEVGFDYYVKENEGYKFDFVNHFQNNFDINAANFYEMLDEALLNNNLTGNIYYFPRKMLLVFAQIDGEKIRKSLGALFDQTIDVAERIDTFKNVIDGMMAEVNESNEKKKHSFIDLRFISLLLAAKYPNDYFYIMITPFRRVGKLFEIGLNYNSQSTDGENYKTLSCVGEYVQFKIKQYPEILKVREGFIDPRNRVKYSTMFTDDKYSWITQDFIWVVGGKLDKSKDPVSDPNS